MATGRNQLFFEEVPTRDIEVLSDSKLVEKFAQRQDSNESEDSIDISNEVTLYRRTSVARPDPRTIVRPVPEALVRLVRERSRPTQPSVRRAVSRGPFETRIRRSVILPWPAALMILAVLGAVTFEHARRGDTRGALLYSLSSTRSALSALGRPASTARRRSDKAVRAPHAVAPGAPEYWMFTFAPPEPTAKASALVRAQRE